MLKNKRRVARSFGLLAVLALFAALLPGSGAQAEGGAKFVAQSQAAHAGVLLGASAGVRKVSEPGEKFTPPNRKTPGGDGTKSDAALAVARTCWTAFAPPVPAGAALAHWYNNCNSFGTYQYGGYQIGSGTPVNLTGCFYLPAYGWALWTYGSTASNANYSTYPC